MRPAPFGIYHGADVRYWVIDRHRGEVIFNGNSAAMARRVCNERNAAAGFGSVAPSIHCLMCYGLGFVTDPDKTHPSLRCDCAAGKAA